MIKLNRLTLSALKRSPLLVDLVGGTHVLDIVESFIGRGNMVSIKGGQIALRHPTTQDTPVSRLAKHSGPAIPSAFKKDGKMKSKFLFF